MDRQPIQISELLDPVIEQDIRELLIQHFAPAYRERTEEYVATLLAVDHFASRFYYLQSITGDRFAHQNSNLLVSGFSVGSEMVVARYFGFGEIYGVEVEEFLVDICRDRLKYFPFMFPSFYDGNILPYQNEQFHVVTSGHVIEHTQNPALYLNECMRVLVPDGFLTLEFPNRYHKKELHTNLPSFEWLPRPVRNACLRLLSSRVSPFSDRVKDRYRSIVDTNLQQISVSGVKKILKRNGQPAFIRDITSAAPGIIRCIIQKAAY